MRSRLIVLIDFSPFSETLISLANTWAKSSNADIILLHQVPGLVPAMADSESREEIIGHEKETALNKLKALAQDIISVLVRVTYQVTQKNLITSLNKFTRQEYNDLILVGLKGTGIIKQLLIGSTATRIIEESNSVIVAVPIILSRLTPEKLILALSYTYPVNEKAFNQVLDFFNNSIQHIEFISVITADDQETACEQYLVRLQQQYRKDFSTSVNIFKDEDALTKIKTYAKANINSILVVQKGSRSLKDQFFRRFFTSELIHDGSIPLIILPL